MKVTNPATEEDHIIEETPIHQISNMVGRARQVQIAWSDRSLRERVGALAKLPELVEANLDQLASCVTQDMGKPVKHSRNEVANAAAQVKFFCQKAEDWLAPEEATMGFVEYDPLGVVAVISPWNGPFIVPVLAITPALLAGNGVVFKPSENSLRTGREVGNLFDSLDDVPRGLVQTVIGGKDHGRELVGQDVDMVSFTGSGRAGKDIMKKCSDKLCRVLLELGGLDAAIVLNDADISLAARKIVRNNCNNTGQICCAVKRVYVEKDIYEDFVKAAVAESQQITYGDPAQDVDMGPLVAKFQLDKVQETVNDAREQGAKFLTGGQRAPSKGYFFPSTIVTNVNHEMKIMTEEPFGPLLPIFPVDSWEEAVRLANNTRYGLTGSVWTRNENLGRKIMRKLEVGVAALNTHGIGPVGTPFGGAKESGIGRIKTKEGMRANTNVKMVRVSE